MRRRALFLGLLAVLSAQAAIAQTRPRAADHAITSPELLELRRVSSLTLSPDLAHAVVRVEQPALASNTTVLAWRLIDIAPAGSRRLAGAGEPIWSENGDLVGEQPQWSADSRWIYYRALKGEEVQVWRARIDRRSPEQVTRDASDVLAFVLDPGGRLHYAVAGATRAEIKAAEDAEYDAGVVLDGSVIGGPPLVRGFPVNGRMATLRYVGRSPSPRQGTLLSSRSPRILTMDLATRRIAPATRDVSDRYEHEWSAGAGFRFWEQGAGRFRAPANRVGGSQSAETVEMRISTTPPPSSESVQSRSGTFLVARQQGFQADLACDDPTCLDADALGVVGWSAELNAVVFQTLTFGAEAIHVWNLSRNTVRTVTAAEGVFGSMYAGVRGACALAWVEVICLYSAADRPSQVIAIDLSTGARRILFDPNPGFSSYGVGVVDKIVVEDRFGRRTLGRLVLPRAWTGGRLPLVITSYTCQGFLFGGTGEDVPEHVLAGLGYAALCIDMVPGNVQPSAHFEGAPEQVSQSIADFLDDAIRVLDKRGVADPQRVAIAGFSGSTTGVAFALTQTTYAAAIVTTTGSADIISCYLHANTGQCRRLAEQAGYTPPFDLRSGYWSRSPAWNAARIATPLLMQLGEAEHASMLQLYGAFLDYDRAVEMVIFAGVHHFKHEPRQRLSVYQRNVDWARFWLKGETREGMIDQYDRWRGLRARHCDGLAGAQPVIDRPWFCPAPGSAG